ncbi:DNA (cytosine-5)-methyltransferase 1 [Hypnocyclicus thermotrophus]|uniref:DNA (cytosine-5-)-methyltransferase n=1 Tax=Hypnocyclicus thermotrophus TaxID=1627895 RepID=A0AA46DZC5_9FUSO|nr:DNA cytosine methyltransferase [Hypnocyclicus thermotrophus]TDT71541.1 DNA (cytosine-5)-methyltransferase 1 [Hypnocyclicus thermotrophus]
MKQNKPQSMSGLTLGSLFDGSGGFPLGGLISGITPVWASEIEPFPIRVTTKRLPFIKHYGDVSKLDGAKIEPVDIITFGSPCQDMSVAGKRKGLNGNRSSLFYEAIRIIKEMRCATNGKYPRYIVWENVPGAFSSNKGEDFRAVLEEICKIKDAGITVPKPKKWSAAGEIMADEGTCSRFSVAWRVLDAQYWGVPQRRKRIFLVADFAGRGAGEILFKSEGLSGYSAESFRSWQRTTSDAIKGIKKTSTVCLNDQGGKRMDLTKDVTCTLRAESHHPPLVFENHSQDSRYKGPLDVSQTILSTFGTGGNNQPFVVETPKTLKIRCGCEGGGKGALIQDDISATLGCNNDQTLFVPKVYGICSKDSNSMKSDNPNSGIYEADTSRTIDANGSNPSCNQGGMAVVESYALQGSMIGRKDKNGPQGDGIGEEVSFTLNTADHHAVAYGIDRAAFNQGENAKYSFAVDEEVEPTMVAKGPGAVAHPTYSASKASFFTSAKEELANTLVATDYKDPPLINDVDGLDYIVRRLTPIECASLQGFPKWWCSNLETKNPTQDEIILWKEIFKVHAKAIGKNTKPKTDNQIRKWLQKPHSDSAEYKMWGNGVALPCVCFVLSGIVWFTQFDSK